MITWIRLRLRKPLVLALAGRAMTAVALAGLIAAIAVRGNWWWPFLVILAAGSVGYLFGLSAYSVGADGPAREPDTGYPVSP
ncbi:MAG TPA: hypothetical protein VGG25_23200 [Streptosporangiaceae bacterium]|jgi:hypothetical protein